MSVIGIIATLDTKGDQAKYLIEAVKKRGHNSITIDVGVLGKPSFRPSISREQVAQAAGKKLQEIVQLNYEFEAMSIMTEGACKIVKELFDEKKLSGIVALGGSMGTSLALKVMKILPIGFPKLIVSTIAHSPAIHPDMIPGDLLMLQWIGGLWGLNSLSKNTLEMAASVICGAAEAYARQEKFPKRLVAVTSLGGLATRYMSKLKPEIEKRGYEVAAFHATGMGGRVLEQLIYEGVISAVLDLSVGLELLNFVVGTAFSAGEHRLEAAAKMGIPQIVSPGLISRFHWGAERPLPWKYAKRPQPRPHNYLLNAITANVREQAAVGKLMAEKLNRATGPAAVVVPLKRFQPIKGFHHPPVKKRIFDPEAGLKAFLRALKKHIKPHVKVVELPNATMEDDEYIQVILQLFDAMTEECGSARQE